MDRRIKSVNDIKSGYLVETKNGNLYMCIRFCQARFYKCFIDNNNNYLYLCNYNYKFEHNLNHNFDIVKIYGLSMYSHESLSFNTENRPLLWEEKTVKMTIKEIEEKLGYNIEIVED